MSTFQQGLLALVRLVVRLVRRIMEFWCEFIERFFCRKDLPRKDVHDVCCVDPPRPIRARPDPYIYSQWWLDARRIAYTWDNPDFRILDATGTPVDPHNLAPNTTYTVETTIHNTSFMAAIGTNVTLLVLEFGTGPVVDNLGTRTIDVPAGGSAVATFTWTTQPGHHCLQAAVAHPDDANPLNNLGQHNVDVVGDLPLGFRVHNDLKERRSFQLTMDVYRLPEQPQRPKDENERRSLAYLRRLQDLNDARRFGVPADWGATLSKDVLDLDGGASADVMLTVAARAAGRNVNVHVRSGKDLVGGITARM